ncbi:hypothetical protein F9U64_12610 [Gracilibacillus oryzae]|uniref:Flagellar protein FliT n=1 Tax=Gracilibacillus oryzae TaxID=1672701 RepID=A0A7C8GSQ5_9BACI|nr:hypothetical protein [Gracilibacillus oryzae]KAB8132338.1 hypothetical protein F9U64_12610 [Gracilibacillus oryzae]
MKPLQEYIVITNKLLQVVDQPVNSDESREEIIKNIDILLEKRQELIPFIKSPFEEEEISLGKDCLALDQKLEPKLQKLLGNIKTKMRVNKKQTRSTKQYLNPYQQLSTHDGMFLDSRK